MKRHLYVGTYTKDNEAGDALTGSEGIYHFLLDTQTGSLEYVESTSSANPSYLGFGRNGAVLYAVGELMGCDTLSAFSVDEKTGALAPVSIANLRGDWACHLSVFDKHSLACVAHYWSGTLTSVRLDASSGAPVKIACDLRHHADVATDPAVSRVHSATFSPDGRFVLAADLGLRRLYSYQVNAKTGWLTPNSDQPYLEMPNGEAPRHLAFHPNGQTVYLVTEADSHLFSLNYDAQSGRLTITGRLSTLPEGVAEKNMAADVHVSFDGRFVYASNRGHNSIACFRIDGMGKPVFLGCDACGGNWPRSFCLEETGRWMVIANQFSEEIVVLRVDRESGRLCGVAARHPVPRASCIKMH